MHAEACVAAFEAACAAGRFLKFVPPANLASESGLLTRHRSPSGVRTLFEEHLVEAAAYLRDRNGVCRLHVTALPQHVERCEELLAVVRADYEARFNVHFVVAFSILHTSTDTVGVDQPGGHQALIGNLNDLGGDLIFITTVDDVGRDECIGSMLQWRKVLGGHLVRIQREIFRLLASLSSKPTPAAAICDALHFVRDELRVDLPTRLVSAGVRGLRDFVVTTLNRPVRVCGMVRGDDNRHGGPFWVKGHDGTSTRQIVEPAQVDLGAPDQQAVLRAATHFNPVDLACGVRNWRGDSFDLSWFIDPAARFVPQRSSDERRLAAVDHQGLWNGAMAEWNTLFVEIPAYRPIA